MKTLLAVFALSATMFAQGILGPIVMGSGATGGGGGGVTLTAHTIGHAVDNAVTASMDTSGANFIACLLSDYSNGPADSFSDSKSNTWSSVTAQTNTSGFNRETIYYVVSPTVGSGHTFSNNTTGSYSMIACAAFSGVKTSSTFESQVGTTGMYSGGGSIQFGSVTPNTAGDLIISALSWSYSNANATFSVDSSFNITDCFTANSSVTEGGCLAYLITSSTAAQNPGWTNSSVTGTWAGTNAVFAKQ